MDSLKTIQNEMFTKHSFKKEKTTNNNTNQFSSESFYKRAAVRIHSSCITFS